MSERSQSYFSATDDTEQLSSRTVSSTARFPFNKLAPEIRNLIYELALVANGTIVVMDHPIRVSNDMSKYSGCYEPTLHAIVGSWNCDEDRVEDDIVSATITPGLVGIHPSLGSEAQSVLYAKNSFSFHGFPTLLRFLENLGPARTFLRDVQIVKCCNEYADAAASQIAMGLLSEAVDLRRLHFGIDASWPFVTDHDEFRFIVEKDERVEKMSHYLVGAIARIFREQHRIHGITAEAFLKDVFSVHPTSFELCKHLPRNPFLSWETRDHFDLCEPCMEFSEYQSAADELRSVMMPLLEAQGRINIRSRQPWRVEAAASVES